MDGIRLPPRAVRRTLCLAMMRQYELVERVKEYDPDADEAALNRAVKQLKWRLIRDGIMARDINANNVCVRRGRNGRFELILVDGAGHHYRWGIRDRWRLLSTLRAFKRLRSQGRLNTVHDLMAARGSAGRG